MNELKRLAKQISGECKWKFDGVKVITAGIRAKIKKDKIYVKKYYVWNPTPCSLNMLNISLFILSSTVYWRFSDYVFIIEAVNLEAIYFSYKWLSKSYEYCVMKLS